MKSLLLYEKQLNILFYYIHKIGICKYFAYSFQKIFTDTHFCNASYMKVTFFRQINRKFYAMIT